MRFPWKTALGFTLSAALLYVALRNVQWSDMWAALSASNLALWGAATVVSQLTFPLRAQRWRVILAPVAPGLSFGRAWRATAVGMMVNNTVPARIGEPTRAFVLSREEPRVSFATALASLVVDRTFDALVVLLLLLVAVIDPAFSAQTDIGGRTIGATVALAAAAVLAAFVALYLAVFLPARAEAVAVAVARRLAPRWTERVRHLVAHLSSGLQVLRDPRAFVAVLLWTVAHWVVNAAAFWLGFRALGLDVPVTAALLTQGIIVVAVALPQAPAFIGAFESAAFMSLALYGVAQVPAVSWAVAYHVLSFIPITVIGAYYLARLGISLAEVRRAPPPAPIAPPPSSAS